MRSHAQNVRLAREQGFVPLHAITASDDEWDDYEWALTRAIQDWAVANPSDPDVPPALARTRGWNELYLAHGRETLGFGLYLFRRD